MAWASAGDARSRYTASLGRCGSPLPPQSRPPPVKGSALNEKLVPGRGLGRLVQRARCAAAGASSRPTPINAASHTARARPRMSDAAPRTPVYRKRAQRRHHVWPAGARAHHRGVRWSAAVVLKVDMASTSTPRPGNSMAMASTAAWGGCSAATSMAMPTRRRPRPTMIPPCCAKRVQPPAAPGLRPRACAQPISKPKPAPQPQALRNHHERSIHRAHSAALKGHHAAPASRQTARASRQSAARQVPPPQVGWAA